MLSPLDTLAHAIAYEAARADIECNCTQIVTWRGHAYYDTGSADAETREDWIDRAITYLDGRGLLLRHPSNHAWVTIKDAPEKEDA